MNIQITKSNDDQFLKVITSKPLAKVDDKIKKTTENTFHNFFNVEQKLITHTLKQKRILETSKDRVKTLKKNLPEPKTVEAKSTKKHITGTQLAETHMNTEISKKIKEIINNTVKILPKKLTTLDSINLQKKTIDSTRNELLKKSTEQMDLINKKIDSINNLDDAYKLLKTHEEKNQNRADFTQITKDIELIQSKLLEIDGKIATLDKEVSALNKIYLTILDEIYANVYYLNQKSNQLEDSSLSKHLQSQ